MKAIEIDFDEVAQDMTQIYNEFGKLTKELYKEHGKFAYSTIVKKFGKFNNIKRSALGDIWTHSNDIELEDIVQDLRKVHEDEGRLTQELYLEKGMYSRKPILKHFGSWNNMMKELGFDINCEIDIPDEDLLAELVRLHKEYDNLSATIMKHHGKYSVEVYQRRFGSFNKAVEMVGLDTHVRGGTSATANAMIRLIEDIIKEKAIPEATADWFVNPDTGRKLYVDAFFPAHNLAFEYNGPQHYKAIDFYGGEKALEYRQKLDKHKENVLTENGFNLIVFSYKEQHTREHMIARLGQVFK